MSEIKWIKLSTGVFDNRKIKQIERMPDGDALIVIWFKLLVLAGNINDGGAVWFTRDIPYTDQLLASEFNRPLTTIQLALDTFLKFGMIEIVDNIIQVSNWEKYQSVEGMERIREQTRKRVAECRERKKLTPPPCNATCNATVTHGNGTDKDIEEDIDKDIDNTGGGNNKGVIGGNAPPPPPAFERHVGDPLIMYAADNLVGMNADLAEELTSYREQMTDDMIRWAINQTLSGGSRAFSYTRSILNRIVECGFKSLAEVKAAEEKRRKEKDAKSTKPAPHYDKPKKPMNSRDVTEEEFEGMFADIMNRPRSIPEEE